MAMRKRVPSAGALMKRLQSVETKLRDFSGLIGETEDLTEVEAAVYGCSFDSEDDGSQQQSTIIPSEKEGIPADIER